jgi:hypothetical protein
VPARCTPPSCEGTCAHWQVGMTSMPSTDVPGNSAATSSLCLRGHSAPQSAEKEGQLAEDNRCLCRAAASARLAAPAEFVRRAAGRLACIVPRRYIYCVITVY